jgi:hypothetical protein
LTSQFQAYKLARSNWLNLQNVTLQVAFIAKRTVQPNVGLSKGIIQHHDCPENGQASNNPPSFNHD